MSTTTQNSRRPTHRIYAVTPMKNSDKGFFQEIGAAWTNRDGKGFNCRFTLFPTAMSDADIVIREIDEAAEEARRNSSIPAPAEDYSEGLPN
jgi:hypothetical protein